MFTKTRSGNYTTPCPDGLEVNAEGVQVKDGCLLFLDSKFKSEEECQAWLDSASFSRNKVVCTETKELALTDADWELIKPLLVKTDGKSKDDYVIFQDNLAHNIVDRDDERFPKQVLQRFATTIVGKRKLVAHDWSGGAGSVGRYFKAKLKKVSIEDAMKQMNYPDPKASAKMFNDVEVADKGIYWLEATYYVPKHKETAIQDISDGLYPSSIGFIGVGFKRVEDDQGNTKWWEYVVTPKTEAVEGSLVGVEAQHGAGTSKNHLPSDKHSEFQHKADESQNGDFQTESDVSSKSNNGGLMKYEIKSLEMNGDLEDLNGVEDVLKSIDEKVETLQNTIKDLESDKETAKTANEALTEAWGEDITPEAVKEFKLNAEAIEAEHGELKSMLVDEVVMLKAQVKLIDPKDEEKVKELKKSLIEKPVSELKEIETEYVAIKDRDNPVKSQFEEKQVKMPVRNFELD